MNLNQIVNYEKLPILTREEERELGKRISRAWGKGSFDAETNTLSYTLLSSLLPGTKYMAELVRITDMYKRPIDPVVWSFTTSEKENQDSENEQRGELEFRKCDGLDILITPYDGERNISTKVEIRARLNNGYSVKKVGNNSVGTGNIILWDYEAVNKFVERNTGLAIRAARNYILAGRMAGFEFWDLFGIAAGEGLLKAARKFDYRRGLKFSTYVEYWTKHSIKRAIEEGSNAVHMPAYKQERLSRIRDAESRLNQSLGRAPTDAELSTCTRIPPEEVGQLRAINLHLISLDRPISDDYGEDTLGEFVIDERVEDPSVVAHRRSLGEKIEALLSGLPEKERDIIRLRHAIADGNPRTLEEVGHIYEVTRERVRQIEKKAMKEIRRSTEHRREEFAL